MTKKSMKWLSAARETPNDVPAERRAAVLQALRGDYVADDLPLVRALFDAELDAVAGAAAPALDDLELAAFLLSRVGAPEDIWRMAQAKFASDVTASQFPGEFLLFRGLAETRAFLAEADHPLSARVRYYLFDDDGRCYMSDERLARWARHVDLRFSQLFADAA